MTTSTESFQEQYAALLATAGTPLAALKASLPLAMDLLDKRQAGLIGDAVIDQYVSQHWLEWNGGTLRLTTKGREVWSAAGGG
ncbi:MAG: hypothetical protein JWQ11_3504 [Rhizobacter sp.]|nr:hypothetical protein [Rhizobacter sp.]